jgi:hypothetical protein
MDENSYQVKYRVDSERFQDAIKTLAVVNRYTRDNLRREIKTEDRLCDHAKLALSDYAEKVYTDITSLCEEELALLGGYNEDGYYLGVVKAFYSKLADRTLEALQSELPKNNSGVCPICQGYHEIKSLARGIMEDYLHIAISVEANLMSELKEELEDELIVIKEQIRMEMEQN